MAGIGFELRKLFQEQGLVNNVKAYAYSSLTTIGPMVLCMFLIIALQRMMSVYNGSYLEWELYISTVTYCFIFSIIMTSGISMVITRFIADMIYQKKYEQLLSSYYGALIVCLPVCALVAWLFLREVSADASYKLSAYLFFMELIIIWIQGIYLSALKDYMRIVRSFAIGVVAALLSGFLLFTYSDLQATTTALLSIDIGFFIIAVLSSFHFEQMFPRAKSREYFTFLTYFKKYPSLFFTGCFVYGGVYIHSFVYWFGPSGEEIANRFLVMPSYDLPVFYAFLSVVPSMVVFVVSVETSFYEKFRVYYLNVLDGGTFQDMNKAKQTMQKTLLREVSFLMEVQLLFTILSIALGMKFLPKIGFTMAQLDLFLILTLGYFLFIIMFVLVHVLMYFDDRKGVLMISGLFIAANAGLTYWMMNLDLNGFGMFIAAFVALAFAIGRLLHVLRNIDYYTFCSQPLTTKSQRQESRLSLSKSGVVLTSIVVMAVVLSACSTEASPSPAGDQSSNTETTTTESLQSDGIAEDKRIYERDEDGSIKALYVTIMPDKAGEKDPVNWYGLNRITDRYSEENLEVIMQEGNEDGKGPVTGMFGYGADMANAKISLRGNTARYAAQKSYKIKLFDEAGLWQNQRTLNLNKHSTDLSRLRNKLSFDLLEQIPHITSLRTQFVHLYVKDLSEGKNTGYEDYGLYSHIEQPNEMFLKSHWLDPYGQLYKVTFFEFQRYANLIKSQSDPDYDKAAFETILEIKGREEHDKLIEMLDDLNNMNKPIDEVIEEHFDLENFLTWTAINILMDNMDTDANNFYLYSPLNSKKWYLLPWDYDGGWELQREGNYIRSYQAGLSNFWGSTLHNRYFRNEEHVNQLKEKVEELAKWINKDTVEKQLNEYKDLVKPFLFRSPDMNYLPGLNTSFDQEMEQIVNTPERGVKRFLEDLEKPKPFYMDDVDVEAENINFSWGISFDLQGDDLLYDVTVARDPAFTQVVATQENIQVNSVSFKRPADGFYYWRVAVRDSAGHEQTSFDSYTDEEGNEYNGIRQFEVE
ncbi:exopolysaccharide Pel transporter PelG [Paenibacillus sinopodophylli]|uniref:exopolysaccharide Pel transporter PelG n=1 Tax=Paenibacillus sinopodophylli TaxID=1837342 RepID=UPI00110CB891|nr:exopolysaccharide Pel transporter PelG [Paenibacillus sinopodophylli]